jgi:hypothetical protein
LWPRDRMNPQSLQPTYRCANRSEGRLLVSGRRVWGPVACHHPSIPLASPVMRAPQEPGIMFQSALRMIRATADQPASAFILTAQAALRFVCPWQLHCSLPPEPDTAQRACVCRAGRRGAAAETHPRPRTAAHAAVSPLQNTALLLCASSRSTDGRVRVYSPPSRASTAQEPLPHGVVPFRTINALYRKNTSSKRQP